MVFGSFIGAITDLIGRRNGCLVYCITYSLSCCTKHFNDFRILAVGRILGGLSTSLLFSVFDSWMISEHFSRGFDDKNLRNTFSLAM